MGRGPSLCCDTHGGTAISSYMGLVLKQMVAKPMCPLLPR
jgi:hypothetical protein